MENNPEAAPQGTEAAPQTAATEPVKNEAPEINAEQVAKYFGTDTETLGKFQKFVDANGKFDSAFSKMKTDISNPTRPAEAPAQVAESQKQEEPTSHTQAQPVEAPKTPKGAITRDEWLAKEYFKSLSTEEKYSGISNQIRSGEYLKEMAAFGIQPLNQDGSINDEKVRMYLDLKAQTVPAKPTESEPNASAAPTVTYTEVGDNITDINQAYQVLMEKGHPATELAEKFIKNYYSKSGNK